MTCFEETDLRANVLAAISHLQAGQLEEAENLIIGEIAKDKEQADVWSLLGVVYSRMDRDSDAETAYKCALHLNPRLPEAWSGLAGVTTNSGNLETAETYCREALKLDQSHSTAYLVLAKISKFRGDSESEEKWLLEGISENQDAYELFHAAGLYYKRLACTEKAVLYFSAAASFGDLPATLLCEVGQYLFSVGYRSSALTLFKRSVQTNPISPDAHFNLGVAQQLMGDRVSAKQSYLQAIDLGSDDAQLRMNMAFLYLNGGEVEAAIEMARSACELDPSDPLINDTAIWFRRNQCLWLDDDQLTDKALATSKLQPFFALSMSDSPSLQLEMTSAYDCGAPLREICDVSAKPSDSDIGSGVTKIRLGFFSADLHYHATAFLIMGLLRELDRDLFEIYCYAWGQQDQGEDGYRRKIRSLSDQFYDFQGKSDQSLIEQALSDDLHVAFDLKGFTQYARPGIFVNRVAPIQINYLGYPGTLGQKQYDFLIADQTIVPQELRRFYSEKIMFMPDSYQPNDDERKVASSATIRADHDLPESAFVLCCFNNSYKITSAEFDIWMRIMANRPDTVLWLLDTSEVCKANLRHAARSRGIDEVRLIFAKRVEIEEHLERHRHADLFLDTFNVNAHTTAADALWGGLPLVTKQGEQFAARVAASLLSACGLTELITHSEQEYEGRIIELIDDDAKLSKFKRLVANVRNDSSLFDTARYARNFERIVLEAVAQHRSGSEFSDIHLAP